MIKVRIIKSSFPEYWYAHSIGAEVEVEAMEDNETWEIIDEADPDYGCQIDMCDTKIILDKSRGNSGSRISNE